MLDTLDAAAVRRWCGGGLAALRTHQHEIDELNVYPVPDGDTGTNLVLTLAAAHQALLPDPPEQAASLGQVLHQMARGALLGARGNSGVIVSQILRAMADTLAVPPVARGRELAAALRTATDAAYAAVANPVEGTVLSVLAAAAEAADRLGSDDVLAVAEAAASAAAQALARTPSQLPALARAGVVDAGGRGLCVLLDALVEAVGGVAVTGAPSRTADRVAGVGHRAVDADHGQPAGPARPVARECGSVEFAYEVQYLLDAEPDAVQVLRRTLGALGDSLVVVGTGDGSPPTWNVHVHVDDIGAAIEAGVQAGRPYRIVVTRFADQQGDAGGPDPAPTTPRVPAAGPAQAVDPHPASGAPVDLDARA
ncbi:MAG TPA: DAK2 domain-containing protein, partial [Actinoplanes sp.]|nr:DAK2 domain-containing protein [Actinoplanes sp.]